MLHGKSGTDFIKYRSLGTVNANFQNGKLAGGEPVCAFKRVTP